MGDTADDRYDLGAEVFAEVYNGVIDVPPKGMLDFADIMISQLFAEHWSRAELAIRDRRLLTLAVIAADGDAGTWAIHLEAALRNQEFTDIEAREMILHLSQYVGYPRASPLLLATEEVIAKVAKWREAQTEDEPATD
jgi:4-carboxymuconolactone decarboxylase